MMTESQKLAIKLDKDIAKIIDSSERKKLVDAYLKLFSGFAWVNWTKKQSLGRAWQSALGQCAGFLKTKDKNNPVTKYLNNVADAHKKCWSRVIMTHKDSPNTLDKTPAETEQLQKHGTKLIRESMDVIKLIMARHNVRIMEITGIEKTSAKVSENQKPKQAAQITQEKPVQQMQQPQQKQQIAQPQVATMEKQMPQEKPVQQAQMPQQKQQIAQPQVATMEKQMPQVKPVQQLQMPQQKHHIAQPQVATMKKQMPQTKPVQQVQMPQQQTQIPKLNSATDKQIVQRRINLFILAKYNQKTA